MTLGLENIDSIQVKLTRFETGSPVLPGFKGFFFGVTEAFSEYK
jgi:hypothetical protein